MQGQLFRAVTAILSNIFGMGNTFAKCQLSITEMVFKTVDV
jgi:hypothetical protein